MRGAAATHTREDVRRHESACESEDDEIEQQFQNTYDEVIALKKLLQDLLNVGDAADDDPVLGLGSPPSSCSSLQEEEEEEEDECYELPPESHSERESGSEHAPLVVPARMMCFSDEMRTFAPDFLSESSSARTKKETTKPVHPTRVSSLLRTREAPSSTKEEPVVIAPRASRSSLKLLRESATFEPNFQARMQQFVVQNRQKKEQIRLSVCEKEAEDIKSSPAINQRSKRIFRDVSHLMAWNFEKESKISHLRQEEVAKQDAQVAGKPAIARHSSALFDKRDDEIALCKVEDRLQLLGLIYQYQQEERLIAQKRAAGRFHPSVAPHSANLRREAPLSVHERLYQLSKRRTKRKNAATGPDNQTEHDVKHHHNRNRTNEGQSEAVPAAVQRLWSLGEAYKKKKQELLERQNQRVDRLLNTPKLSSKSRQIALERSKKDAIASSSEGRRRCKRCVCCQQRDDLARTGAGRSKPSCRVDPAQASAIYEKQLQWKHDKEAKDRQLKLFYDELMESECTFKNPHYRDAWNTLTSPRSPQGRGASSAFFDRTMRWAMEKEKRLEREKKFWEEIQLSECTFQPKCSPRKKRISSSSPRKTWSPGKGMVVGDDGGSCPASSLFSDRYCSRPLSPRMRQLPSAKLLTKFTFPTHGSKCTMRVAEAIDSDAILESTAPSKNCGFVHITELAANRVENSHDAVLGLPGARVPAHSGELLGQNVAQGVVTWQ